MSQPGTIGRLSQVIDRWIYTACLCFGLDFDEQRGAVVYDYSIYQVEYSRIPGLERPSVRDEIAEEPSQVLDVLDTDAGSAIGVDHTRRGSAFEDVRQAEAVSVPVVDPGFVTRDEPTPGWIAGERREDRLVERVDRLVAPEHLLLSAASSSTVERCPGAPAHGKTVKGSWITGGDSLMA